MKIAVLMEDTCGNPECKYEHGLSVYVETQKHKLLIDTGASETFLENASKLQIDLTQVDTVILSHGHYDHSGGIMAFYRINPDAEIYMQQSAGDEYYHGERYIGIDKRIARLPNVHLLDGDFGIDEELFLFSRITGRKYFAKSNLLLSKRIEGRNRQDTFAHEQCLVITQNGKHTLISGCAHNGILNIIERYKELFGDDPDTVISGFHMMKKGEYSEEERQDILETAKELCKLETTFYTGHCTGQKAIDLMAPVMKEKLRLMHCGEITILSQNKQFL